MPTRVSDWISVCVIGHKDWSWEPVNCHEELPVALIKNKVLNMDLLMAIGNDIIYLANITGMNIDDIDINDFFNHSELVEERDWKEELARTLCV